MEIYRLIHVKPDKSEEILRESDELIAIKEIAGTAQYDGTWLSDTRKILKQRKGELRIHQMVRYPELLSHEGYEANNTDWVRCMLKYGGDVHAICFNRGVFLGCDRNFGILWLTYGLTDLAEVVGKELAYEIGQLHDQYFV